MVTKLSIIISSRNVRALLLDCLRSIQRCPPTCSYEVIVVDNVSTDGTVAAVSSEFPEVLLLVNEKDLGFAGANNRGLGHAAGDYLLLLNSDTIVKAGALDRLVDCMERHSEIGLLGPQLLNKDESLQMSFGVVPNLFTLFVQSLGLRKLLPRSLLKACVGRIPLWLVPTRTLRNYFAWFRRGTPLHSVEGVNLDGSCYLTGACLLIRRLCLTRIGLLDENFFMYAEDADYSLRAHRAGWKVRFLPDAQITHLLGGSTGPDYREASLEAQRSVLYFFYKNRGRVVFYMAKSLRMLGVLRRLIVASMRFRGWREFVKTWELLWSLAKVRSFPPPKENPLFVSPVVMAK